MDEVQSRLAKCFERVFPDMSIAAITLVNVIEDEFGFQMDFDLLPELDSFQSILEYLKGQVPSGI